MIRLEDTLEKQLAQLIKENKSFVIYRLPLKEEICFVAQLQDKPQEFDHLSHLNGLKGFVISPFKINEIHPVILIHPEIEIEGLENIVPALESFSSCNFQIKPNSCQSDETDKEKEFSIYKNCFIRFIEPLRKGTFKKLVLSRSHKIEKLTNFSPLKSFLKATDIYPHMMCYLCFTPQTGIWMGCTPEIILSGKAHQWQTVALAGTIPAEAANDWNRKNIEEQEIVSEYIRNILASHTAKVEENGPYTVQAGNIAHLKTEFSFTLNNNDKIGNLLDDLYPTPAICGFPKQEAFEFLVQNEAHSRKYYSGIIGKLDPENETNLYVNLRCAKIDQSSVTLYAGSGIMPESSPESEWEETNYKMQTLLNVI